MPKRTQIEKIFDGMIDVGSTVLWTSGVVPDGAVVHIQLFGGAVSWDPTKPTPIVALQRKKGAAWLPVRAFTCEQDLFLELEYAKADAEQFRIAATNPSGAQRPAMVWLSAFVKAGGV